MQAFHSAFCCFWLFGLRLTELDAVSVPVLTAQCGAPMILPCSIAMERPNSYRRVTWYKLANETSRVSLIRRQKRTLAKEAHGKFRMDYNESLIIREIQSNDSGRYRCFLWAKAGQADAFVDISLQVSECPPRETLTSSVPFLLDSKISAAPNFTSYLGKPLTVSTTVLCLLGINLGKGLLSYVIILVIVGIMKSRKQNRRTRALQR